jgi:hypothetical protein
VTSVGTDPDVISELLALIPTKVARMGDALRSARVRERHSWFLDVGQLENTDGDLTGTGALRQLLTAVRPAIGRVATLPDDCDVRIWWSADSDSPQGGFVLPADLAAEVGAFGVDVYATVWVEDGSPGEPVADEDR